MTTHDEIRRVLGAATRGEWRWASALDHGCYLYSEISDSENRRIGRTERREDALLIAHAPEWIAQLLGEIDDLTARVDAMTVDAVLRDEETKR